VGYEEGGQLTEAVRRKPYSVVLLDEIEKAHPDTFNILLQIMDDGQLTDNLGHKVNFKNTVIIMTSNVGARLISKGKSMGFAASEDVHKDYLEMKGVVMEEVKRHFNPEFLNRIDDIIVFHPLTKEESSKILVLILERVIHKLKNQDIVPELTPEAQEFLLEKGFDPNYGARPLLRVIQRELEDPMAEELLARRLSGGKVYVDLDPETKKLVFSATPHKKPVRN
jgi:ATP-dependent Clp protease ATP-binding subunit ClpC